MSFEPKRYVFVLKMLNNYTTAANLGSQTTRTTDLTFYNVAISSCDFHRCLKRVINN